MRRSNNGHNCQIFGLGVYLTQRAGEYLAIGVGLLLKSRVESHGVCVPWCENGNAANYK